MCSQCLACHVITALQEQCAKWWCLLPPCCRHCTMTTAASGHPSHPPCSMTDVFSRYFGQYRSSIQGVGGDQVMHLMYRLQYGALPTQQQVRVG